jgi:hypothetical protein
MMARTIGVGLVDPTTPVRPGLWWVKAGTWRLRADPSDAQVGHCHPTGAESMQSVQIGRSQRPHTTEAGRSVCR